MPTTVLYTVILVLYFSALMGLGFWFNRRNRSRQEYFLARGDLGPATLGFSYSATQMSGSSYMGAVGTERELGYNFAPAGVSSAAAAWFTYILLGERLRRVASRIRCTTIVDVFEARYQGKAVGMTATGLMLVAFIPLIAAQLKAAGNLFEVLLGMPYLLGLVVFGGIVILYTVIGGMHAVAWTDLIQGSIMIVGFAVLAPVAVNAAGGFSEMHLRYSEINPGGISFLGDMPALWVVSSFLVWGFFQIGGAPAAVTRFLIPKDRGTLRRALVFSIGFSSFIFIGSTLIAISSGVLLPDLQQTDLALRRSCNCSCTRCSAGSSSRPCWAPPCRRSTRCFCWRAPWWSRTCMCRCPGAKCPRRRGLRLARWTTLGIGALAMTVAVDPPATILFIVTMSFSLLASAFTFPLLLGMWWPRATRAGGLVAMVGGAAFCVLWYVLGYLEHGTFDNWIAGLWPALIGPLVSLVLLVVVSLVTAPPPREVHEVFFAE